MSEERIIAIRDWVIGLVNSMISIIRILLLSKFKVDIKNQYSGDVLILGNGPSLTDDLQKYPDFVQQKELICVNHFPKTPLYEKLKPSIYVTSAPDLWLDDIEDKFVKQSKELFDTMSQKTNWPLSLYIPFEARKYTRWQQQLAGNSHISIKYFNNVPVEGWKKFTYWCFKKNLGMPRPHNVMIPCFMISLSLGFQKIFMLGADHSWLPEITVTDTNEVLISQKHFYDRDTAKGQPLDKRGKGKRTLPEILHKFMTAFSGYFIIEAYAKFRGVQILNATKGSFIDAFQKVDLDNYKNE